MSWMTTTREDKVNAFRKAGGKNSTFDKTPEDFGVVMRCLTEEYVEFDEAADKYASNPTARNRRELCKEWADLQYVLSQAALFFEIPADAAFNRVHNSNMTKVVDGKARYREDGKILKPDTYEAPDMGGL